MRWPRRTRYGSEFGCTAPIRPARIVALQQLTDDCLKNGWEQKYISNALGARLSDDRFILRKGQSELFFDWHPQHGGQITGPQRIIKGMAAQFDLPL